MKIYRPYRFRIYPTLEQQKIIIRTFDATRYVYNYYLHNISVKSKGGFYYKKIYNYINELPKLINTKSWLSSIDISILISALYDLMDAFKRCNNFQTSMPNYKRKSHKNSYRIVRSSDGKTNDISSRISIDFENKKVALLQLGEMKYRGYRQLDSISGQITHATVSKDGSDRFYVSITFEQQLPDINILPSNIIGIDLGVKTLVSTSDGTKYENMHIIKNYEDKISALTRILSKRVKNSKNYIKTKKDLAVLNRKLANSRKFYLHNISRKIVNENDVIVCEKLYVKQLVKGSHISKEIYDQGWHELVNQLYYKSKWDQKQFYQINQYYPSSQICNICDRRNFTLANLNIRKWECSNCGAVHDRDINAAINIQFEGLKKYMSTL